MAPYLSGGGGAPGPQTNLNAEIYYPPYLFGDTSIPRIAITSCPAAATYNQGITVGIATSAGVEQVTLVKTGSVTHSVNFEQCFFSLPFTHANNTATLTTTMPASRNTATPGNYLLFVFSNNGVPSVASTITLL